MGKDSRKSRLAVTPEARIRVPSLPPVKPQTALPSCGLSKMEGTGSEALI